MIWLIAFILCTVFVIAFPMPRTNKEQSVIFKEIVCLLLFVLLLIVLPFCITLFQPRTIVSSRVPIDVCQVYSNSNDWVDHENYVLFANNSITGNTYAYEFRQYTIPVVINKESEIETIETIVNVPKYKDINLRLGLYGINNYTLKYVVHVNSPSSLDNDLYITSTNDFNAKVW